MIPDNETSTQTCSHNAVAHFVPLVPQWQFLMMNVLIRPLVGQLVRAVFGTDAQRIEVHSAFATLGKYNPAEALGDPLETFFEVKIGCEGVRRNAHRHAIAEIQCQMIPAGADTI
jgi:hypothetical protein